MDRVAEIIGKAKAYASAHVACAFQGEYTNGMLVAEAERKEAFEDFHAAVTALAAEHDAWKQRAEAMEGVVRADDIDLITDVIADAFPFPDRMPPDVKTAFGRLCAALSKPNDGGEEQAG